MSDIPPAPTREDFQGPNARNPFLSDVPATRSVGALANSEQQRSIAEVQARMLIARANPRDPIRCMDLILRDCTRPTLAEKSLYQYARGGSSVSGPSIRLAEAIAQRWGNIASGIKEISRSGGYSECVAYAWDLESGFYDERQYQVKHWRDTRQGGHPITDERDIYELVANMGQRRKRAVLLTVIPGDVVEAAQEQCEETLRTTADTSPEALSRIIAAFDQYGVTKAQLEKRCQCRFEAVRPAQIVQLRKIYASLKDGMSEPGDWFEAASGTWSAVDQAHEAAKPVAEQKAPRKAAQKKAAAPPPAEEKPAGNVDDGLPFDRWDQETADRTAPAMEAAQTPATPADAQPAGEARNPPVGDPNGFKAWLVDGDGQPIPVENGVEEAFTDPVAFARAFKEAEASEFPGTLELFKRANHDALAMAMAASTEVAPILTGTVAQPAGEDYGALADGILLDIASLESVADVTTWHGFEAVKVELEKLRTNAPDLHAKVIAAAEAREKELTPPKTEIKSPRQLADEMILQINSCSTVQQIVDGLGKRNREFLAGAKRLMEEAPALLEEVKTAAEARKATIAATGA